MRTKTERTQARADKALSRDGQTPNAGKTSSGSPLEEKWRAVAAFPMLQLEYGTLPALSGGAGLTLGVTRGAWYVFATAALFFPQISRASSIRDYAATWRNRSIEGWVCRAWEWKPLLLAPCGLMATHLVTASTSGKGISSRARTATWVSVGLGVKPSLRVTSALAVILRVAGRVALNQPEFLFVDSLWGEERVRRAPHGVPELSVGPEWLF